MPHLTFFIFAGKGVFQGRLRRKLARYIRAVRSTPVYRGRPVNIQIDNSRDALLTDFGKDTLRDRYTLPGESYQEMFARVAAEFAAIEGAVLFHGAHNKHELTFARLAA